MKKRLDQIMLDKKIVLTKSQANMLIKKGDVQVDGVTILKAGKQFLDNVNITITSDKIYVGRGAYKLLKAIEEFKLDFKNCVIADCGASTGGFTQICLENNAKKVYAIDVGHNQLHPMLDGNPKVQNIEGTNLKEKISLPEQVDYCVVDLSFISIRKVLPNLDDLLTATGKIVLLFKPQFEVGREYLGKNGIVSTENQTRALEVFEAWLKEQCWNILGQCESPIQGKDGNQEYLFFIKK